MMPAVPRQTLGSTGITVSRLCFGTLTMGPLQRKLAPEAGAALLHHAFRRGVNFVDTAQIYGTYPHIREFLKQVPRQEVVIMTRSYAWSEETAREAVEEALEAMDTDNLDLFLMHEQESEHTLRGHREALDYYMTLKERGVIKAIGLSTHRVAAVTASLRLPEIEVLFPIFNPQGLGIGDGTLTDMITALTAARQAGKAVVGMKALGGGHLLGSYEKTLRFSLEHPLLDAVAVGMQSAAEIDANCLLASGKPLTPEAREAAMARSRHLHIGDECVGCGSCVFICRQKALKITGGKAAVDRSRCILCSYCVRGCPQFCIKII
ncbi:MAG: aldo/keto reductase [Bacillota bacterium]|nr:aldo/keto reductase [Bacillota bacterium]